MILTRGVNLRIGRKGQLLGQGFESSQSKLRRYRSPDGTDAALALDFTRRVYGANLDASLAKYAVGDKQASFIIDFTEGQYAANTDASLQKYSVNGRAPGLLIDVTEAQYGRQ